MGYKLKNIYIRQNEPYSDMRGPCPIGFHIPLISEWTAIYNVGASIGAWAYSNVTNMSTYLKLPLGGYRRVDTAVYEVGTNGRYWISQVYDDTNSYYMYIGNSQIRPSTQFYRSFGMSIRGIKDTPTIPDSSWTVLYQGTGSAGIYYKPDLGLISLSSDGTNWYTIMDKNIGATQVYNYGDTLSESNCGKFFQRGNNYGFNWTGSISPTSNTKVNVTGYGPGNYYESSTWITQDTWQSTANNGNNLRGGVSKKTQTELVEKQVYSSAPKVQPVNETFSYTGSDQTWTVPYTQEYIITAKGAGSRSAAGGLAKGTLTLNAGDVLSIMVGATGNNGNGTKYGFGGSANGGSNAAGGGLSGVFTGSAAITASDSSRALIIGGGAGGSSAGTGGQGGGTTGGTGSGSYGTAGAGGTQTGRGSGGNAGSYQFNGGNGSRTYGYGGGGGWRGGNGSIGDGSGDDDRGGGGGSGYVISTASDVTLTTGGGSTAGNNGQVTIVSVLQ